MLVAISNVEARLNKMCFEQQSCMSLTTVLTESKNRLLSARLFWHAVKNQSKSLLLYQNDIVNGRNEYCTTILLSGNWVNCANNILLPVNIGSKFIFGKKQLILCYLNFHRQLAL